MISAVKLAARVPGTDVRRQDLEAGLKSAAADLRSGAIVGTPGARVYGAAQVHAHTRFHQWYQKQHFQDSSVAQMMNACTARQAQLEQTAARWQRWSGSMLERPAAGLTVSSITVIAAGMMALPLLVAQSGPGVTSYPWISLPLLAAGFGGLLTSARLCKASERARDEYRMVERYRDTLGRWGSELSGGTFVAPPGRPAPFPLGGIAGPLGRVPAAAVPVPPPPVATDAPPAPLPMRMLSPDEKEQLAEQLLMEAKEERDRRASAVVTRDAGKLTVNGVSLPVNQHTT